LTDIRGFALRKGNKTIFIPTRRASEGAVLTLACASGWYPHGKDADRQ
jgi:hypothetical protein